MIALYAADERAHERRGKREVWHTPFREHSSGLGCFGLGALQIFDELLLPRGARLCVSPGENETVTYLREGALICEDLRGRVSVLHAGAFSRSGNGLRAGKVRVSGASPARVFQIGLRGFAGGAEPSFEHAHFGAAQRRGRLCLVASPDGRNGSLRLRNDVLVYAAVLERGHHVACELPSRQAAWIHVATGELNLAGMSVTTGDGFGVVAEPAVSFTAQAASEIIMIRAPL